MTTFTTTYPNPDTDGIACVIAYAEYLRSQKGKNVEAVIKGQLNPETIYALDFFRMRYPRFIENCSAADEIFLFDTHHLAQISGFMDCAKVTEIFDHHPNGNPEAFEKAIIANEMVGAAATLVVELFQKEQYDIPQEHAGLLYTAIISNTLDFTAPTTTVRDKDAATWLSGKISVPENFAYLMFEARSDYDSHSTESLLNSDCKIFEIGNFNIAISQIEGVGAERVLSREDLMGALQNLAVNQKTNLTILSTVDIYKQCTTIVPANEETNQLLTRALELDFTKGSATVDRILLRKSDLIPPLKNLIEGA